MQSFSPHGTSGMAESSLFTGPTPLVSMIIPASKIPFYCDPVHLPSVPFPLVLRAATGDIMVSEVAGCAELLKLAAAGSIVAIGTWNRIRYLRLNHMKRMPAPLHWQSQCATLRNIRGLPMLSPDPTKPPVPIWRTPRKRVAA